MMLKNYFTSFFSLFSTRAYQNRPYGDEITAQKIIDSTFQRRDRVSYFLLHASYGDKWCILSFMNEFLTVYPQSRIIADEHDYDLARIFLGEAVINNYFIFVKNSFLDSLSSRISYSSPESFPLISDPYQFSQLDPVLEVGFPNNCIRHLHIVKYPYFCELYLSYGVPYGTLLKTILYLPNNTKSSQPKYYEEDDLRKINELIQVPAETDFKGNILFNVVNMSQLSFTDHQIKIILRKFKQEQFRVIVNVSQHPKKDSINRIVDEFAHAITLEIPGHLLALLTAQMTGVVGILGGAMNVAVQFSNVHCLGFFAHALGWKYSLSKIYGGKSGGNAWRLYDEDWPCFTAGRILMNVDIEDPSIVNDQLLIKSIDEFITRIT